MMTPMHPLLRLDERMTGPRTISDLLLPEPEESVLCLDQAVPAVGDASLQQNLMGATRSRRRGSRRCKGIGDFATQRENKGCRFFCPNRARERKSVAPPLF